MQEYLIPKVKYAGLKLGHSYHVLEHGRDYAKLSVNGQPLYVPLFMLGNIQEENFNEGEQEYE